jgi:hypothetical protein
LKIPGFVQPLEILENPGFLFQSWQTLENPGFLNLSLENPGKLRN